MGETQCRCDSLRHFGKRAPVRTAFGIRSNSLWRVRLAVVVLVMTAAQLEGPFSGRAWAQESPAPNAAAPTTGAPLEGPASEPAPATAEALSLRYRFIEKYSATEDPNHPELITQYQVGIVESQKLEVEKAQGAPDREEISQNTIYTERVAQASKVGEMVSVVRRYDKFATRDVTAAPPSKPPLFRGLAILIKRQASQKPKVISLTADRPLREREFSEITKQVIVPQLTALLPPVPKRVGDSWSISRVAAYSLVSEIPDENDFELKGTLTEVKKAASGPGLVAVIDISGQMNLSLGLSSLRAQLHFVFDAPAATAGAVGSLKGADDDTSKPRERHRDVGVVDARGRLTRVRMLWAVSDVLPESEGRLKQTTTYDLTLERRFTAPARDGAGAQKPVLAVPDPLPTANEANSWVVYDDPLGRFHFSHPQELLLKPGMDRNSVELFDQNAGTGQDVIIVALAPGNDDPDADRKFRDPQQFQRGIDAYWAKRKLETLRGPSGWLPETGWAPLKVFRKELGVKTAGADDGTSGVQRIYIDNYLVLAARNECFHLTSWTVRNDHIAFRTQAESIIKSFVFKPRNGQPEAPATAPPAATVPSPK